MNRERAQEIGNRLSSLRGNKTQKEVAFAIGIRPSALSMYENGKRVPTDEIKVKLAKYYHRSVSTIFYA